MEMGRKRGKNAEFKQNPSKNKGKKAKNLTNDRNVTYTPRFNV